MSWSIIYHRSRSYCNQNLGRTACLCMPHLYQKNSTSKFLRCNCLLMYELDQFFFKIIESFYFKNMTLTLLWPYYDLRGWKGKEKEQKRRRRKEYMQKSEKWKVKMLSAKSKCILSARKHTNSLLILFFWNILFIRTVVACLCAFALYINLQWLLV